MKRFILMAATLIVSAATFANPLISESPENARVYFISPLDGQTVQQKFKVRFGLVGMGVAPSGVVRENTGHHHILIDTDIESINLTTPLPATDKIKHYGGGHTETELELSPGKYSLQLLLGNYVHIPHVKPVVSEKITVIVK